MNANEQKIVRGLVAFLSSRGWSAKDPDPIETIRETGEAWISFKRDDERGSVYFVEGNDSDIISDWSASKESFDGFSADVDAFLDTLSQ